MKTSKSKSPCLHVASYRAQRADQKVPRNIKDGLRGGRIIVTFQSQSALEVKILDGRVRKTEITLARHWEMSCEGTWGTWMSCRKEKRRWDWSRSVRMLKTLKITVWIGRWWWEDSGSEDDDSPPEWPMMVMKCGAFLCWLSISSFCYGWSLRCLDTAKILDLGICQVFFFSHKVYFCSPVTPAATESRRFCFCLISLRNGSFPLTSFVFPDRRGIQLPPGCGICEWIPISEGIHLLLSDKQHTSLTVSTQVYTLNL